MANKADNKFLEFLKDEQGQFSSMRAIQIVFAIVYCVAWLNHSFNPEAPMPTLTDLGAVLGTGGLKLLQKAKEKVINPKGS